MDVDFTNIEAYQQENPESSFGDYFKTMSSVGMLVSHPELYKAEYQEGYNPFETRKEEISKLTEDEKFAVKDAVSDEDFNNKLARVNYYKQSMERVSNDPLSTQLLYGLGAATLDPVTLLPMGGAVSKANSLMKASTTLGRMAQKGAIYGTVGATSNVASEALMEAQGLPTDYVSSALFGFALGGGIGGIAEGVSRTLYSNKVAKTLTEKDDLKAYNEANVELEATEGHVGRLKTINGKLADAFLSPVAKAWGSTNGSIRDIAAKIEAPHVSIKDTVTGTTAVSDIKGLNGQLNKRLYNLTMAHRDASVDGTFKGNFDDFLRQSGRELSDAASKQEIAIKNTQAYKDLKVAEEEMRLKAQEAYDKKVANVTDKKEIKKLKKELESRFADIDRLKRINMDKLYTKNMPTLSKGAMEIREYFKDMLVRGKEDDVPIFRDMSENRLYVPRQVNYDVVRKMEVKDIEDIVYKALKQHPDNISLTKGNTGILKKVAKEYSIAIKNRGFDKDFNDFGIMASDSFGVDKHLQGRKFKFDTSAMGELLQTHAGDVMGGYHYWMRGQFAARRAFPELRGVEVNDVRKVFQDTYVNPLKQKVLSPEEGTEINALQEMFDDMMGTLRMPSQGNSMGWIAARVSTQANAMSLSGMMGLVQMLELPTALWATKFNRLFHKQFGTLFKDAVNSLRNKDATVFQKELMQMGYNTSLLETHGINRIAETESVINMNKIEGALHNFNSKVVFKYNGMRAMTAWLESLVASNAVVKLRDVGTTISEGDMKLFNRWGLSEADVRQVQAELKRVGQVANGNVISTGIDKMNPEIRSKFQTAMSRAIDSGVMQGDSMQLPTWLIIPTPIKKVLTQFMRFPFIANEILLRRGVNEDQAGWAAAALGSYMMAMGMFYLIDEAEVATGTKSDVDRKYDLDTDEGLEKLMLRAVSYNANFGALLTGYDYGMSAIGMPKFGSDYASRSVLDAMAGPTGGRINDTSYMMNQFLQGNIDDEKAWDSLKRWYMPLSNMPFLGSQLDTIIDENTIRR